MVNNAVLFTATDKAYLSIANASQTGLNPGTSDFSISFWIKPTSLPAISFVVNKSSANPTTGNPCYMFSYTANGAIGISLSDGSGQRLDDYSSDSTVTSGSWQNYTIVFNRTNNAYVYKNGNTTPVITLDISSMQGNITNTLSLEIGSLLGINGYFLDAALDSFGFWNKALSEKEVVFLYNSGKGQVYKDLSLTEKIGLVTWWDFDEDDGRRYDAHGTNHLDPAFSNIIDSTSTLGSELVVNGTFDDGFAEKVTNGGFASNTGSWTAGNLAALASVAGGSTGNCLELANNAGTPAFGYCYQGITTVVGVTYTASMYFKKGTAPIGILRIGTSIGDGQLVDVNYSDVAWAAKTVSFVATTTTTYISFTNGSSNTGLTSYWDTVSVTAAGWTAGGSATIASVAGGQAGNCLQITNVGANQGYAYQTVATTIGQNYTTSCYYKNGTSGYVYIVVGSNSSVILNNANWTLYTFNWRATATSHNIYFYNGSGTDGQTSLIDTVSTKALTASNLNGGFELQGSGEVLGSELVLNPSFSTLGGGGADVWASWSESTSDGAIANETTLFNTTPNAAKLTAGANKTTEVYQAITVSASTRYKLTFWTMGDGTYAGRYYVYDNNSPSPGYIVASTSTGITSGASYSQITKYFTTPAGCTQILVSVQCPTTAGGIAYFDDVSIKQVTSYAPFLNWTTYSLGSSILYVDSTTPNSGTYSTRMDVDSAGSYVSMNQSVIKVGHKYKITAYVKSSSAGNSIRIDDGYNINIIPITTSYAQYTSTITALDTSISISRYVGNSITNYIDDVTLICTEIPSTAGIAVDGNLSASFTDSSKVLFSASNSSLQIGVGDFTIGAWVNFNEVKANYNALICKSDGTGAGGDYALDADTTDGFRFLTSNGTAYEIALSGNIPVPNTWYFVVGWLDRTTGYLNIQVNNGTVHQSAYPYTQTHDTTNVFELGRDFVGAGWTNGRVDGAFLIKRVLTAAERTAMFNNGKGVKYTGLPLTVTAQGPELVINGGFDTNTNGWAAGYNATIASVAGGISGNCCEVTNGAGYGRATIQVPTVIGKNYLLSFAHKNGTFQGIVLIGSANGLDDVYNSGPLTDGNWTTRIANIKSTTTSMFIQLVINNNTPGRTTFYDAVSLVQKDLVSFWNLDEYSDGTTDVTRMDSVGTNNLTSTGHVPSAAGVSNASEDATAICGEPAFIF